MKTLQTETKEMSLDAVLSTNEVTTRDAGARASVQLMVVNNSSRVVKTGGKWAVKDENANPPVVQEAIYGRISPGNYQERYVTLPSGFEWGIFHFEAEDGSGSWTAPHGGNNTVAVKLTLGD